MVDPGKVERAIAVIKNGRQQRRYFFNKLDDPEWIEPLREKGFFLRPPDPIERDGGFAYPDWPEASYLARMAALDPGAVGPVVAALPATENVRVRADILRAAAHLDRDTAVRVSRRERAWIETRSRLVLDHPGAAAELIIHLAELGATQEALALMAAVLAVLPTGHANAARPRSAVRLDEWTYGELSRQLISRLSGLLGTAALSLAADLLQTEIEQDGLGQRPIDYSEMWRPAIEDHAQNIVGGFRAYLIDALRDAAMNWIGSDPERLRAVIDEMVRREWIVFRRIALHLLAGKVDVAPDEAIAASLDGANYFEPRVIHEWSDLSNRVFPLLTAEQRQAWFASLDEGPSWPPRDRAERQHTEPDVSEDLYQQMLRGWRRDRLTAVEDHLSADERAELAALVEELGPSEHPVFTFSVSSWVGPTSPLDEAELREMSPTEIGAFVRTWAPTNAPMNATADGLGRALTTRVTADPAGFSVLGRTGELDQFDPTYVRSVLRGLEEAVRADRGADIDWDGALHLVELAVHAPELSRGDQEPDDYGRDTGWGWCRRDAASLLGRALSQDEMPPELGSRIWSALEEISWDPDPLPAYEQRYGGSNMDPLTLSLNTTRGQAMHAVVQYATWRKRLEGNAPFDLTSLPLVSENLEAHLDPQREPSESTRGVFGSRLAELDWLDPEWLRNHLDAIFPQSPVELRLAAWETFLAWSRPSGRFLSLLTPEYSRAVEQLPTLEEHGNRIAKSPGRAMAEHLGTYAWWGLAGAEEDGLLHRFATKASSAELAHLVSFIGRSLDGADAVDREVQDRLLRLWPTLEVWVSGRSQEEQHEILAPFGWWYGSGRLEASWLDDQLIGLLQRGVVVDAGSRVADQLITRASEDLSRALAIVRAYSAFAISDWRIFAMRDVFRMTLDLSLKSGDSELARLARQTLDDFGTRGMLEFRDLLTGHDANETAGSAS